VCVSLFYVIDTGSIGSRCEGVCVPFIINQTVDFIRQICSTSTKMYFAPVPGIIVIGSQWKISVENYSLLVNAGCAIVCLRTDVEDRSKDLFLSSERHLDLRLRDATRLPWERV
jgi:hypothetical protein